MKTSTHKGSAVVIKAGGMLLETEEKIVKMVEVIRDYHSKYDAVFFICSAMGKTTDLLLERIAKRKKRPSDKEVDRILCEKGEEVTVRKIVKALNALDVPAVGFNAEEVGLLCTGNYGDARLTRFENPENVSMLSRPRVMVIAGFQGYNPKLKSKQTLGRGGSDKSAVAIAAMMKPYFRKVDCIIFKEVDGIYAVDPRIVPNAMRYDEISFGDMIELSEAGAGVLMDGAVRLAESHDLPFRVILSPTIGKSTGGTLIGRKRHKNPDNIEDIPGLRAIAITNRLVAIRVANIRNKPGVASKVFSNFRVNILEVNQEPHRRLASISCTIRAKDLKKFEKYIQQKPLNEGIILTTENLMEITIIDKDMEDRPGYLAMLTEITGGKGVNIEMIRSFKKTATITINSHLNDQEDLIRLLAEKLKLVA